VSSLRGALKNNATARRAHRGEAMNDRRFQSRTIEAVLASNNAPQEQRSMPGPAPHSRCPHKRSCCYFFRLEVGFASLTKQAAKLVESINLADRFFKLGQVHVDRRGAVRPEKLSAA
jgi:hypothetical protein